MKKAHPSNYSITVSFILLVLLLFPVYGVMSIQSHYKSVDQTSSIQFQNDWIFLQDLKNINNNGNYLIRNATYHLPVTQSEVNSLITVDIKFNSWYVTNTNPVLFISLVLDPNGNIVKNDTAKQNQNSLSINFQPSNKGLWEVILYLDQNNIKPLDPSSQAEANVDIQVSVSNLQAAISYEVNEIRSWSSDRKILTLRSFDKVFSAYFYINQPDSYTLVTEFYYSSPTISNVSFIKSNGFTVKENYSSVKFTDVPIIKRINLPVEGIWKFQLDFITNPSYTVQVIQLTDALTEPLTIYMNPPTGSSLFIDNNFDGVVDVNDTLYQTTSTSTSTSNSSSTDFSFSSESSIRGIISTTVPWYFDSIFLGLSVLSLVVNRKQKVN